ncbi:MAG: hypothetical protein ACRD8A_11560 [Candidatus Acidiferrales bacterium]
MNRQSFSPRVGSLIRELFCVRDFGSGGRFRGPRARMRGARRRTPEQSGYALLLVLFMMTLMLITSTAIFMNRRTEGMRDREDQTIWRGNQFVRAIRVYYRKTGHYPQNVDDLQKGVADLHFIRPEALKDPMNSDGDGKWRFIYTNAAGQIIGSVKYATMQQMAILDLYGAQVAALQKSDSDSDEDDSDQIGPGSTGACPPGTSNAPASSQSATAQSTISTPGQPSPSAPAPSSPLSGLQLGGTSATQNQTGCTAQLPGMPSMAPAALKALVQMKPTGAVDSPVIGGFLVGVGSTVDRTSVKVYKGGKKYDQWEFIYNPVEEQALAIQQGLGQAGAAGGLMGSPAGPGQPPTSQPPQIE